MPAERLKLALLIPPADYSAEWRWAYDVQADALIEAGAAVEPVDWTDERDLAGYDLVLVGAVDELKIDVDAMEKKLASPEYAQVAQSLREIGFNSATELLSTFAGNEPMLRPWLADAQINRDKNLRLQFLAGLGLNLYDQAGIYSQMVQYRRYPEGLFTGTPEQLGRIRMATGGF